MATPICESERTSEYNRILPVYIVYGNLHEIHRDRHVTVYNIPLMFYQFWGFYNLSLCLRFVVRALQSNCDRFLPIISCVRFVWFSSVSVSLVWCCSVGFDACTGLVLAPSTEHSLPLVVLGISFSPLRHLRCDFLAFSCCCCCCCCIASAHISTANILLYWFLFMSSRFVYISIFQLTLACYPFSRYK